HVRGGARPPGRARAGLARPGDPAHGRGRLPLPVHRRHRVVPRAGYPLPADAARRGAARRARTASREELRMTAEATARSYGRAAGRTVEIQRLIGRALRGVIDFGALGENTIWLDCDVLTADGGTRCASITGAYVALALACDVLIGRKVIDRTPLTGEVAAVSCGIVGGVPLLDLDYSEDSTAEVDANVVMTGDGGLVEVQAT